MSPHSSSIASRMVVSSSCGSCCSWLFKLNLGFRFFISRPRVCTSLRVIVGFSVDCSFRTNSPRVLSKSPWFSGVR